MVPKVFLRSEACDLIDPDIFEQIQMDITLGLRKQVCRYRELHNMKVVELTTGIIFDNEGRQNLKGHVYIQSNIKWIEG